MQVKASESNWQHAGVILAQGSSYEITAQGEWRVAPTCKPTGPDGEGLYGMLCWDSLPEILSGHTNSALIAKVGKSGTPFAVGKHYELATTASGPLYLRINDAPGHVYDTSGQMRVTISLLRAAPDPEASQGGGQLRRTDDGEGGGGAPRLRRQAGDLNGD